MTDTDTKTTLRAVLEALRADEDVDDGAASWAALIDLLAESGADMGRLDHTSTLHRALAAQEACQRIAPTRERCADVNLHTAGYAEPGYSDPPCGDPPCGVVATGNWNDVSYFTLGVCEVQDATPGLLAAVLERLGVPLEWSVEWAACDDCGKLVRTQPDSWSWNPHYCVTSGELLCLECHTRDDNPFEQSAWNIEQERTTDDIA